MRWRPDRAVDFPELVEAVARFDAGDLPAAIAAAEWLKQEALREPLESATRLCVAHSQVLGYYALANGSVALKSRQRRQLGVHYVTQPAIIVTWIAKSIAHEFDGSLLVEHALGSARRAAQESTATVLGLDPFDADTAEMWKRRYGFRDSLENGPGRELPRMFVALT